ncbi:MAG: DUF166 family (seleno)protein DfsP [Desulfatibacillaceae bacterium]|nr:DUF166 family (seleno)protein DfsP [Desulfatibacillaceae bacterium]
MQKEKGVAVLGRPQRVLVFEQSGSGQKKIRAVSGAGKGLIELAVMDIASPLEPVLDSSAGYLPAEIEADLVLNYLVHPDLAADLSALCNRLEIPVVAPSKKHAGKFVFCPPTCCGLAENPLLGIYGRLFGAPQVKVSVKDGKIDSVEVLRAAPCGATQKAAKLMKGVPVAEAPTRFGLATQFGCMANPAGWDPIYGRSPVHFAGHIHSKAFARGMEENAP